MRQEIPQPPPQPKLYYQMQSNLKIRAGVLGAGAVQSTIMSETQIGGNQQNYEQQPHLAYAQHQQRPYHRAKQFIADTSNREMRYAPIQADTQRSVQSQIGGGYTQHSHHPRGTITGSSSSALRGIKHNKERYLIQATDGSKVNIQ